MTASVTAPLEAASSAVQTGVKNATKPELLATVAGFAGSRVLEVFVYENFREVFGDNSAEGGLTSGQQTARTVMKAAAAIAAAGVLIPQRSRVAAGLGVGLSAGLLWHVANDFGINV